MTISRTMMIALGFSTVISVVALIAILLRLDPAYADTGTFAVFYLSVFAAVAGLASWSLMAVRAKLTRVKRPLRYFFRDAFRQGLLVSMIVTLSLYLQAGRHLTLLWTVLIVAFALAIEAYATRSVRG